jgi:hypothetical protein
MGDFVCLDKTPEVGIWSEELVQEEGLEPLGPGLCRVLSQQTPRLTFDPGWSNPGAAHAPDHLIALTLARPTFSDVVRLCHALRPAGAGYHGRPTRAEAGRSASIRAKIHPISRTWDERPVADVTPIDHSGPIPMKSMQPNAESAAARISRLRRIAERAERDCAANGGRPDLLLRAALHHHAPSDLDIPPTAAAAIRHGG